MGQTVMGVMLGVVVPRGRAGRALVGDGCDDLGLLGEYEAMFADDGYGYADRAPHVPTIECGRTRDVIGFMVACMRPDRDDLIDLDDQVLEVAAIAKAPAYRRAAKAWARWSKWAAGRGVRLAAPTLWLVPTEVA